MFFSEIGAGIVSPRLAGTYSPKVALEQLLANTPLNFEFINERTVAIRAAKRSEADPAQQTSAVQREGARWRKQREGFVAK